MCKLRLTLFPYTVYGWENPKVSFEPSWDLWTTTGQEMLSSVYSVKEGESFLAMLTFKEENATSCASCNCSTSISPRSSSRVSQQIMVERHWKVLIFLREICEDAAVLFSLSWYSKRGKKWAFVLWDCFWLLPWLLASHQLLSSCVGCEVKWENLSRRAGEEAQGFRKPQYFGQATRRVKLIILWLVWLCV